MAGSEPRIRVLQVLPRRLPTGSHSIHGLFETVRAHLPPDIRADVETIPRVSMGIRNRLVNVAWMLTRRSPVVHITGDVTYLVAALPRRGSVITIHDTGWTERSRVGRALFDLAWLKMPVARAARVTVISEHVRDTIVAITGCDPRKLTVVPNCVHPAFVPAPAGQPASVPTILQVGTLPNKNLERVAAALEGLDCTLHILGVPTPEQTALLQRHRVPFRSSVDLSRAEVVRAYQEASLVVFASTFEGFGLPIVEGQAVGCPVVTSKLRPMADVAGDGACLVDPFDVADIRRGVLRALHDDAYRRELRQRGYVNVARYRADHVAERYAEVYREIARAC